MGKISAGIAACILLVFFFTPWAQVGGLEASGYDLARSPTGGVVETLLFLTPLSALGILLTLAIVIKRDVPYDRAASGVLVILAILAALPPVAVLARPEVIRQYVRVADLTGLAWQFGYWCTVAAGLVAFAGALVDALAEPPPIVDPFPPPPPPVTPPLPDQPPPIRQEEQPQPLPTQALEQPLAATGWVVVTTPGRLKGHQWALKQTTTLGRDGSVCEAALDDESVSRTHATIKLIGQQFYIFDLGSLNKTKVNGVIVQRQLLYDRDAITLGNVSLLFLRA